jgi:hypothetical protein
MKLNDRTSIVFATAAQAKTVLQQRDKYIQQMSPFDRAARMKTDKVVSEKEFLAFAVRNILPWNKKETAKIQTALAGVKRGLTKLSADFPATVFMIKTTGNEEGQAAYTRGNAIILPKRMISGPAAQLQKTIAHELFHVLSRSNPKLRDVLYKVIGFEPCNQIDFPEGLKSRKLTNPDAPRIEHYITLSLNGKRVSAVPILFSRVEKYDVKSGREFFSYLEFRLLAVKKDATGKKFVAIYKDKKPVLLQMRDFRSAYLKQVGENTAYIIHPEEILAENFALLVAGKKNVPSPGILKKLLSVLSKKKTDAK